MLDTWPAASGACSGLPGPLGADKGQLSLASGCSRPRDSWQLDGSAGVGAEAGGFLRRHCSRGYAARAMAATAVQVAAKRVCSRVGSQVQGQGAHVGKQRKNIGVVVPQPWPPAGGHTSGPAPKPRTSFAGLLTRIQSIGTACRRAQVGEGQPWGPAAHHPLSPRVRPPSAALWCGAFTACNCFTDASMQGGEAGGTQRAASALATRVQAARPAQRVLRDVISLAWLRYGDNVKRKCCSDAPASDEPDSAPLAKQATAADTPGPCVSILPDAAGPSSVVVIKKMAGRGAAHCDSRQALPAAAATGAAHFFPLYYCWMTVCF